MTIRLPENLEDCWEWEGGTNLWGYGQLRVLNIQNGITSPHRLAYRLFVGSIPQGMELDHLCKNRLCCNPRHLEAVTRTENIRRSPAYSSGGTPRPWGTYSDSPLWRARTSRGLTRRQLAAMAGVSEWTILNIEQRRVSGPRDRTLKALADALSVAPADLAEVPA